MKSNFLFEIILDIVLAVIAIYYISTFGISTTRDLLTAGAFSLIAVVQSIRTLWRYRVCSKRT